MYREVLSKSQIQEVIDRFNQINSYDAKVALNEYTYFNSGTYDGVTEAGEPNNQPNTPQPGPDPMGGMGADPNAPQAGADPMGGMGADPMGGMDPEGGDDEVIDVEDLTQSQESTEMRIDDMSSKIENLMKICSKYVDALDTLDSKISGIKDEIEHRIPTKQEKLQLRSVISTPYASTPEQFWANKLATNPGYALEKDEKDRESFDVKASDVDSYSDYDLFGESKIQLKNFLQF